MLLSCCNSFRSLQTCSFVATSCPTGVLSACRGMNHQPYMLQATFHCVARCRPGGPSQHAAAARQLNQTPQHTCNMQGDDPQDHAPAPVGCPASQQGALCVGPGAARSLLGQGVCASVHEHRPCREDGAFCGGRLPCRVQPFSMLIVLTI